MSDRKVKIESTVNYTVVVSLPDMRFSRKFERPLHSTMVDYDIIEEGLQRKGFGNFFKNGILRVIEKQDRIDLGLEDEEGFSEPIIALTTIEMLNLMRAEDTTELEQTLAHANMDVVDRFVQAAINSKIYNPIVIKLLEKAAKRVGVKTNIALLQAKVTELENSDSVEDEDEE